MQEQIISFKFDGQTGPIKKNQIDAKLLASAINSMAELIEAADKALNGDSGGVQVRASAGFVKGSFGVQLLVLVDPEVLIGLGIVATAVTGGVLGVLKELRGRKVHDIEIDEEHEVAHIVDSLGEEIETTANVGALMADPNVRSEVDRLIHQPLLSDGITSIKLFDVPLTTGPEPAPVFEATTETGAHFRKPARQKVEEEEDQITKAVVELVNANKKSGRKGWRMNYLGEKDLSVKIEDEAFLTMLTQPNAPEIFARKFNVELETTTKKVGGKTKRTYRILRVVGPVLHE